MSTPVRIRGQLLPRVEDEKHGRWWGADKRRPILYTQIGKHCRHNQYISLLHRWQKHTPNWKKTVGDVYRKRWPKPKQLCMLFFAEFCLREWSKRTLFEVCHRLPFFGVHHCFHKEAHKAAVLAEKKTHLSETGMLLRSMTFRA